MDEGDGIVRGVVPAPPPSSPSQMERNERVVPRRFQALAQETVNRLGVIEAFSAAVSGSGQALPADQLPLPGPVEPAFPQYIPFEFTFDVVPDPKEVKTTWAQRAATVLYWFYAASLVSNAFFVATILFATFFLPETYAKQILKTLLLDSNYINMIVFGAAHLLAIFMALMLLSYPNRFTWGRFYKLQWILILIPNIILAVAVLDLFYELVNTGDLEHQLRELMGEGLDVTQKTMLSHGSHRLFNCCGLDGYKDWDPFLKDNGSIYFGGYPNTCCSNLYIKSCSYPVRDVIPMEPARTPFNQMWPNGCYSYELALIEGTVFFIWIVIVIMTSTMMTATAYLWWVIRHVNIHDITIEHPFYN